MHQQTATITAHLETTAAPVKTAASAVPQRRSRAAPVPAFSELFFQPSSLLRLRSITFLNWTLVLASLTMYSLRKPALQPVPRSRRLHASSAARSANL